jgi:trk system potassium uptake protein TrkH
MNFRIVIKQFGLLLLVLSGCLVVMDAIFFGIELLLHHDINPNESRSLWLSGGLGVTLGGLLWLATRGAPTHLGRREALLLVAVTWLLGAAFAAFPYFLWAHLQLGPSEDHPFKHFVDCYFEAMSGLTTTGATVLGGASPVAELPHSIMLWRAFTQWIGGLGIVVLFVAVLPTIGVGGKRLFLAEAPTPHAEGLQPQIRQTARVLLFIYMGLTVAQITALCIAGMPFFDSVCHTFTTVSTAGFSTRDESVGAFTSLAVQIIVIVFMFLAAVNFGLYFALLRRRFRAVFTDPELRTYVTLVVICCTVVVIALSGWRFDTTTGEMIDSASVGEAVQHGVFNTVSILTTTGYATADTSQWPFAATAVLVMTMFVGGCAGSTAGGIKMIRVWVAFKVMLSEIEHVFRPQVVRPVRVGRPIIDSDLKLATVAYVLGMVLIFAVGSVAVMLLEEFRGSVGCDYTTAATASLASLCTIGPGLGAVGAVEHYGWMTTESKLVLSLIMALGRLEVFAIIVLFNYRFWRED